MPLIPTPDPDLAALEAGYLRLYTALKEGALDERLAPLAIEVRDLQIAIAPRRKPHEMAYLQSRRAVSEAFDQVGMLVEARGQVSDGEDILTELPEAGSQQAIRYSDRELVLERVRYSLAYAQTLYREHKYEKAKDVADRCQRVVRTHLDRARCLGTSAQTSYLLGRVERQLGRYDSAERHFAESIEGYRERAEHRRRLYHDDPARVKVEVALSTHRTTLCLALGFGWVNFSKGDLRQARRDILPAEVHLLGTDRINLAYVRLLRGSCRRSEAGTDRDALLGAAADITAALKEFLEIPHPLYAARASYELALANLYLGNFADARANLDTVEAIAGRLDDVGLRVNAMIVRSRLARADAARLRESWVLADRALAMATKHGMGVARISALIARGVANLRAKDLDAAIADLSKALDLNSREHGPAGRSGETSSPVFDGTCHLFLASAYAADHNATEAEAHWRAVELIAPRVQHEPLHERAKVVDTEIRKLRRPFVIDGRAAHLNVKTHTTALRDYLIDQAGIEADQRKAGMAERLGVTRQTLHEWEVDREKKKTRGL